MLRPPSRRRLLLHIYPNPQKAPHVPCMTTELASCISPQIFDEITNTRALHRETQTSDAHIDGTQHPSDEGMDAHRTNIRHTNRSANETEARGLTGSCSSPSPGRARRNMVQSLCSQRHKSAQGGQVGGMQGASGLFEDKGKGGSGRARRRFRRMQGTGRGGSAR